MSEKRTVGEQLFEQYLDEMGYLYEFEKKYEGKSRRPDFTVTRGGQVFLFDAKDFDPLLPDLGFSQFDPYVRLRQRIDDGRQKFKEFKEYPCCVVLRNTGNAFVNVESPGIVLGAMYGDSGFKIPVYVGSGPNSDPPPPIEHTFLGRGKMVRKDYVQNTTISALISLRHVGVGTLRVRAIFNEFPHLSVGEAVELAEERFPKFDAEERHLGVIVWENAAARIPLSRELFTGRYDQRWGVEGENQTIVFQGDALRKLIV
jgi:hypothetical protein